MPLREGSFATFVGLGQDGVRPGDRCRVLADEGRYVNVRWVSGSRAGAFEAVSSGSLSPDRRTRISAFDDDEFGFEPELPHAVRVATAAVHASGGNEALVRALDHDGVLDRPRQLVRQAISGLYSTLREDRAWGEVVSELGAEGDSFLRFALTNLITLALAETLEEEPHEDEV